MTLTEPECYECADLLQQGRAPEVVDDEHRECHGWTHCACCGGCPYCGIGYDE